MDSFIAFLAFTVFNPLGFIRSLIVILAGVLLSDPLFTISGKSSPGRCT